jgi:hypothetical protein
MYASDVKLICGDCFANSAIRLCFVDTLSTVQCLGRIAQRRFHHPTPRFPPSGRRESSSPTSSVLSRRSDFLSLLPRHFVAFARRYHGSTRLFSSLPMPSRAQHRTWGFGYRFPRAIFSAWKRQDLSSRQGTSIVYLRMFPDSGRSRRRLPVTRHSHGLRFQHVGDTYN